MAGAFLGVDIGTSSSKGVIVSVDGALLATASRNHGVVRPRPGWVESDPALWWDEFTSIAAELVAAAGVSVSAIGVSGMGPCVVLADDADEPVRPAILYGVDTRAVSEIAELDSEFGADEILRRCGSALTSQAVGPKLRWVRDHEPDVWERSRRLFMPSSWLVRKLTGDYVLDHHSASQCTPMYDIEAGTWLDEWARELAGPVELPRLLWPGEVAGTTRDALPGIPAGTPVVAGTIDAWTEAVSVGATRVGDLMLMYGTTMFLVATVDRPVRTPSMWGTNGAFPGTRSLAGGLATSGAITTWVQDLTGGASFVDLTREAAASGLGSNGLLMLPYFAGERTPIMDPDARGTIIGLTLDHTRGDLYRASLEATAFAVRHNIETMQAAGASIERLVAVGGGTQGSLWTQIVSDVTGLPQVVPKHTIGASLGAAFLAARSLDDVSIDDWNPPAGVVEPVADQHVAYSRFYERYRALYPATRDTSHFLARFQHHTDGERS